MNAVERRQTAKQAKAKRDVDNINLRYDGELAEIRRQNPKLPARGTEEGIAFEKEIARAALKYGSTTMSGAYEAWKDTGSGKKKVSKKQKGTASKVGTTSSGGTTQGKRKYEDVAETDLDEAEERAVAKFKKLS